eukprot:PhF_6_TR7874/c0_g1_i1/m.11533
MTATQCVSIHTAAVSPNTSTLLSLTASCTSRINITTPALITNRTSHTKQQVLAHLHISTNAVQMLSPPLMALDTTQPWLSRIARSTPTSDVSTTTLISDALPFPPSIPVCTPQTPVA